MSTDNKAFMRRFFEVMDQDDWDALKGLMHPDHEFRFPLARSVLDRDGHLALLAGFRKGFTDMQHLVADQLAEGDKVVTRGKVRVRHTGEWNGFAATGKTIEFGFINIVRLKDGTNREEWDELDGLTLMRALGALPEA